MISIPSAYGFPTIRLFPATGGNTSGTVAKEDPHPTENSQQDTVTLSGEGKELSIQNPSAANNPTDIQATKSQKDHTQQVRDLAIIQQLKKRDTDVRAHEQAHLAVAGRYAAGGISYSYETGPDGVRYAVGGEVPIDVSTESTPDATLQKMETVRRAALAPADPSSADLQIAAEASAKEIQAMGELQAMQREKASIQSPSSSFGTSSYQEPKGSSNTDLHVPSIASTVASNQTTSGNSQQMMIQTYQAMASLA